MDGDPVALCRMGDIHVEKAAGKGERGPSSQAAGDDRDLKRALRYYRRAASTGLAEAQYKAAGLMLRLPVNEGQWLGRITEVIHYAKLSLDRGCGEGRTILNIVTHMLAVQTKSGLTEAFRARDNKEIDALARDISTFLRAHDARIVRECGPVMPFAAKT